MQVASDITNLLGKADKLDARVNKIDNILSRIFSPQEDWEKEIVAKRREISAPKDLKELVKDPIKLQALVNLNNSDPLPSSKDTQDVLRGANSQSRNDLEQLKKDLNLSVDALCRRNRDRFEKKLDLHTRQLHNAILNSATWVIQSLSGPHDRLHNIVCGAQTPIFGT